MSNLDVSVLYPSEYVKAADLGDKPTTVKIIKIERDKVPMSGGVTEMCTIVHFEKTRKKLIAGKTNGYALAVLFGSDLACAIGKRVTLTADVDTFGRERVPCIRVLGSPDAPPERLDAYQRAWRGKREKGALVGRLKQALARLAPVTPPPIDEEREVEREPEPEVEPEPEFGAAREPGDEA
ncbi:MAG: hypothetical protein M0R22_13520 [Dehalococcoidia bacterium]|jgi:hypothetical protein|nr:hypothetical protein [Dehalococcoidia bacterium]